MTKAKDPVATPQERRHFAAEFKTEAVRRAAERRGAGVPLTQVARELGVTGDLLRSWGRQVAARTGAPPADVFPGNGRLPSDADEVRRLTRELARAQQEIACLKSAAAYFARESRRATSTPRSRPTGGASRRRPPPGLIQHTDRGCQYASREYRAVLAAHGVRQSMSRKGDCFDNAVAEAFFATLEHELLAGADFATRAEAHHAVAEFIELWYNAERRHGSGSV